MAPDDTKKADIYLLIKLGGILSFIPFILAAGPLAGYLAGSYLEKRFAFPAYTSGAFITIGFLGSIRETLRIFKMALRIIKNR